MEDKIIWIVVLLGLAVIAFGLDWKAILSKYIKGKKLQGYDAFSFIESPNVLQVKIQIENIESSSQCESLDEMATIVWKYNDMKTEVQKNKTSNLVEDILAKASKKYSRPETEEKEPVESTGTESKIVSDDYEDFNEVENNQ